MVLGYGDNGDYLMTVLNPFNLVVTTRSCTVIDMLWENRVTYDSIEVWEHKVDGGDFVLRETIAGNKEYYKATGLDSSQEYCYKVRGMFSPEGFSAFCTEDCSTTFDNIEIPTDVVALPISGIQIEVTFKDNSVDEKKHTLQREISTAPDVWKFIVDLEPNREFWRDGALFLKSEGYKNCVATDIGKQVHDEGGAIGVLIAYDNTRRRWLIDSNGHTIVDAESMTIDGGAGEGEGTAARETIGLVKGSSYTYRVQAANGSTTDWAYSTQVTTIVEPAIPTLAVIPDADTQDKSIRIRWTNVENETGYRIERFIHYGTAFWSQSGLESFEGAKVNDGILNVATFETDASAADSYLKINLGEGNAKEFVRVDISISGSPANAIWNVQYSDNDSDWFTVEEGVGGAPLAVGTHEFPWAKAGAHRYWRLLKTNAGEAGGAHAEIQFYEQTKVVGIGITDFLITGLTSGTPYWFKVRAYNAAGNSDYSDVRTKTTLAAYVRTAFEEWIRNPNIEPVYLAEIYTKMDLTGFVEHEAPCYKKAIGAGDRGIDILEVFEDGDAYEKKDTPAQVKDNVNTFHFDYNARFLYVHATDDVNPEGSGLLLEGAFWLYFSTHKDKEFTANGRLQHYLPLLAKEDIPDITQEIKPYFEGSFSISSGSIAFINAKIGGAHFFDKKYVNYTWENSKLILKAGKDDFTYANFDTILTSLIDQKSCNDSKITFTLRDLRQEMERNLQLEEWSRGDFPDIEDDFVGEPIPICFGAKFKVVPVPIEIGDRKYKFHGGRSKSVLAVYKNFEDDTTPLTEDTDYFVDLQRSIITFERDVFELGEEDIIEMAFIGTVNSADEPIRNGAEVFKYFMNEYYGLLNSELDLDSIYRTKYEKTDVLSIYLYKNTPYREIVRSIEHSTEAFTFQDAMGRLGLKPQLGVAESKAKYIRNHQIFDHAQSKTRKSLFWKVKVLFNENPQSQERETKSAQDDDIWYRYKNKNELKIHAYFSAPSSAQSLATSILALLNKETIKNTLPMLLFDVMAGDIVKFSRDRFYSTTGRIKEGSEIDLRIIRISKSPASGQTTVTAEIV